MATAKKPDEQDPGELSAEIDTKNLNGEGIEVEVIDDTPPKDRGRRPLDKKVDDPTDEELEEYSAGVKKRIKELTHARHDERRRAEALEREAREQEALIRTLMEERKQIATRYNAGVETFGKVQEEAAKTSLEAARAKLKAAHEAFDNDAIIEAQEELARATLRVEQAKSYRPAPIKEEPEGVQPRQTQQQVHPDQKSLNWQARNQWFGQDEEATSYALGVHQKLVKSGVDPRSNEYYEQIDARMRQRFPELFDGEEDGEEVEVRKPTPSSTKKPATVVAPADRQPASGGKVRLTQTQLALAKKFGLTPQQYAAQVLKLQQEN